MADTKTMQGLDDLLDKLKALPPEIVSKSGGPVLAGLRKGANVVKKQAKVNIKRALLTGPDRGYVSTKTLERAIVTRRMKDPQRYGANEGVSVRASGKKYPGREESAAQVGRYLELGTEKQPAEAWMTPAYFATKEAALEAIVSGIEDGINKAIAKVSVK